MRADETSAPGDENSHPSRSSTTKNTKCTKILHLARPKIATVAAAHGLYFAHLHFEMREFKKLFIGRGLSRRCQWLDGSERVRRSASRRPGTPRGSTPWVDRALCHAKRGGSAAPADDAS